MKFASTEYDEDGGRSMDHGRILFEELISTYPKKTDIWYAYVNKEIKSGHRHKACSLFERRITLKTNIRNIKTIFKKYLNFEVNYGSEEFQELVKRKAKEYIQNNSI